MSSAVNQVSGPKIPYDPKFYSSLSDAIELARSMKKLGEEHLSKVFITYIQCKNIELIKAVHLLGYPVSKVMNKVFENSKQSKHITEKEVIDLNEFSKNINQHRSHYQLYLQTEVLPEDEPLFDQLNLANEIAFQKLNLKVAVPFHGSNRANVPQNPAIAAPGAVPPQPLKAKGKVILPPLQKNGGKENQAPLAAVVPHTVRAPLRTGRVNALLPLGVKK